MDQRWYRPDETWPRHHLPYWRKALARTREAGWHLTVFSGHGWGKVVCSRDADEPCQKTIFSTGRGSENHSRDLVKILDRCPHRRNEGPTPDLARLGRLLDKVELLLDAARKCLDAMDRRSEIEELLGRVEDTLDNAEQLLDEALEMEAEVDVDLRAARVDALRAEYTTELPPTPEGLVDEAERRLTVVEGEAEGSAWAEPQGFLARVAELRKQALALRARAGLAAPGSSSTGPQPR